MRASVKAPDKHFVHSGSGSERLARTLVRTIAELDNVHSTTRADVWKDLLFTATCVYIQSAVATTHSTVLIMTSFCVLFTDSLFSLHSCILVYSENLVHKVRIRSSVHAVTGVFLHSSTSQTRTGRSHLGVSHAVYVCLW